MIPSIQESEINELAQYVIANEAFVRQLMTMGLDTLVIKGKTKSFALKKYANLKQYFIG